RRRDAGRRPQRLRAGHGPCAGARRWFRHARGETDRPRPLAPDSCAGAVARRRGPRRPVRARTRLRSRSLTQRCSFAATVTARRLLRTWFAIESMLACVVGPTAFFTPTVRTRERNAVSQV